MHNLKEVSLSLDRNQLIVFTGVSGSGKTSLAFDTIYIEGQRRYIESLSAYARRHMQDLPKPEAEAIIGMTPTIAIEQKTTSKSPRSTVGTLTGIYDYLRILFARIGIPHCPVSGEAIEPQSEGEILEKIEALPARSKLILLAPFARGKKGEFKEEFLELLRRGFTRLRIDGEISDLSEPIALDKKVTHDIDYVIDRIALTKANHERLVEGVKKGLELGKGMLSVLNHETEEQLLFSQHGFSKESGLSYPPLEPHDFSFNHPRGMCSACQGLGTGLEFNLDKVIDPEKSIDEDCCLIASHYETVRFGNIFRNLSRLYDFKVTTPWKNLSKQAQDVFLNGCKKKWTRMLFVHPEKKSRWVEYVQWKGVLDQAKERFHAATSDVYKNRMLTLMDVGPCPSCEGARIRPYPAAARFKGKTIAHITAMPIAEALTFFEKVKLTKKEALIATELLKEIAQRLQFLHNVGLHYLSIDRTSPTLSGGEAQRVRLAAQIGSGLVDSTYILDEPSIGLHPRDNHKLIGTLKELRDKGNTVIVVEHDEEMIRSADEIVDIGPLAGEKGGELVFQGSLSSLLKAKRSITGDYLSGRKEIPIPKTRRKGSGETIQILGARHHNLKNINVTFPLGLFIAVTGVSGSGKSSLVTDTLYPALSNHLHRSELRVGKHTSLKGIEHCDKVIAIDQSPIGKTPRSNPATYIKLFSEIRDLFAQLPDASALGFKPGRFSFNVKEGSCPHCSGYGMVKIDMDFLEDEWIICSHCKGKRFDEKTLSIHYRGKNIADVLEMTVSEAHAFFEPIPNIRKKLDMLLNVGLGYIQIGQPSPTLSGGEAQRIKLAKELARPSTGQTLYILDEPTTGLHFHDMEKLLTVLQTLVDKGNTVLVIEHNMDLVKTADWVIDIGPEGGKGGGEIVAKGKPETIAKLSSPTARALKSALHSKKITPTSKERKQVSKKKESFLSITKVSEHNLKDVSLKIPRGKISVCTGPSGSGKTSLALDTIYAEGQRRYVETLPSFARQFIKQAPKPTYEEIDGLSPCIAIEQKAHAGNPRSTIGTMTEAYDYLRLLFSHLGTPYCPETGEKIETISKETVVDKLLEMPEMSRVHILSPLTLKGETFPELKERLARRGYLRLRLDDIYYEFEDDIPFDKRKKHALYLVIDRIVIKPEARPRLLEAIEHATTLSGGELLAAVDKKDHFFNLAFAVPSTGKSYPPITPHTFSFNTESGMCLECLGLGFQFGADLLENKQLARLNTFELLEDLWKDYTTDFAFDLIEEILEKRGIDPYLPLKKLTSEELQFLLHGDDKAPPLKLKKFTVHWRGINQALMKIAKSTTGEMRSTLAPLLHPITCHTCKGERLNPLARNVRLKDHTIATFCALPIEDATAFLNTLKKIPTFLEEAVNQLKNRLNFLIEIGLGYLSLDRSAPTLSGGETQRIRLSGQLGSSLSGCTYILDEPTIGLHPHDNVRLNTALKKLCALGNTLLLVEHDPLTIAIADRLFDFGPEAGLKGGYITAEGTLEEIKKNPHSLTGAYLSGKKRIPLPEKRRTSKKHLRIENAALHNLKNINVSFPVGTISVITGVSGSGKSTLLSDILQPAITKALKERPKLKEISQDGATISGIEHIHKLLVVDQNPIGHTKRADVSTYVDLLTPLRYFFASLPEAKIRGLLPRHFSYNHIKGMCRTCWGLGTKTVQMQLLPPVHVPCDACHGYRLGPLPLQVMTKGKHLGHLLNLSVDEAKEWLPPIHKIVRILDTLSSVGLGYLKLGQPIATLSGGEAQRIRLSKEIAKWTKGKTLYLFDEPTIGLHSVDTEKLLKIFHTLVDAGHTVIIIEHNMDIIANADHVIDLGPGAGAAGGSVIASGTPEHIATTKASLTGTYLKPLLS